jgi:hypothetical protein
MASVLGGRAVAPPTGELVRRVRSALVHAHDLAYLETHPLAVPAGGGRALRRHVLDAIDSLDAARDSGGSVGLHGRMQRLLSLRYADGLTSREVAARLAISQGQYYREHRVGVAALARVLAAVLDREAGTGAAGETRGEALAEVSNLPVGVTSFVGRERELATVADLLSSARLCTLVGVGGVGKTRPGRSRRTPGRWCAPKATPGPRSTSSGTWRVMRATSPVPGRSTNARSPTTVSAATAARWGTC